jgi:hypothetical protein
MHVVDQQPAPSSAGWSQGPPESQVLDRGGWDSRFARVLRRAVDYRAALAVVDSNGDGSELEADAWQHEGGRWEPGNSSGIGSLGATGNESSGRSGRVVWAAGLLDAGTIVTVRYRNVEQRVVAAANGLWVWVRDEDQAPDPDEWPQATWRPTRA